MLIIDGYNVIHQITEYRDLLQIDLEPARDKLIHDLGIYRALKSVKILVVFDGAADIPAANYQTAKNGVHIIYSRAPMKADPLIKRRIATRNQKDETIVVTNDNDIKKFSKEAGAFLLSPTELYTRIKTKKREKSISDKYEHNMTPDELKEWKKLFGV